MALNFPTSPTTGDLYPSPPTSGAPVWQWDGSKWVVLNNNSATVFHQFEYTATAGQTSFSGADANGATLGYTAGFIEVFVNGSKVNKGDFTATTGTSVVLGSAAGAGDLVTVIAFTTLGIANTLTPANNLSDVASASAARANLGAAPAITTISNSLGADVLLNNTANYFDGPSVAQGSSGTWFVSGSVCLNDSGVSVVGYNVKLWDGTTVIASARVLPAASSGQVVQAVLSGVITSPAGNLRISVNDSTATTGKILFNASGNSKDSTITAVRIA